MLDRQLGQQGQCQHFMANTGDGGTPPDPRFGVPSALVTEAYQRCVRIAGAVFDLILRDPQLARWRLAGTYVLIHALEDSFSTAHVNRDPRFQIVHLLSWKLIDWPRYAWHGHLQFPAETHHMITDPRDADFVRSDARSLDGRACEGFHNPYAFPEECLTERAKAAAGTVVDLLVAIYKARVGATAVGGQASLFSSSGDEAALWLAFTRDHLASVSASPVLPAVPANPLRRSDVFVGAQAIGGDHTLGAGLWGAKLFFGLTTPFVLGFTGGAGYSRAGGVGQIVAGTNLALLLPLVRRFTIGAAPFGVRLVCDTHFEACRPDVVAGLGVLLVPLGDATWLGVEGPSWSWTERAIGRSWAGLSFGWSSRAGRPSRTRPAPTRSPTWDPPRVEDVHAFRSAGSTRTVYFAATAISQPENTFAGFGLEWRWDRDVWNRRAGVAPGVQLEIDGGRIEAPRSRRRRRRRAGGARIPAAEPPGRDRDTGAGSRRGDHGPRAGRRRRGAGRRRARGRAGWTSSSIRRRCPTCRPRAGTRCRSPSDWACASTIPSRTRHVRSTCVPTPPRRVRASASPSSRSRRPGSNRCCRAPRRRDR